MDMYMFFYMFHLYFIVLMKKSIDLTKTLFMKLFKTLIEL